jgi:hypothetical protein
MQMKHITNKTVAVILGLVVLGALVLGVWIRNVNEGLALLILIAAIGWLVIADMFKENRP